MIKIYKENQKDENIYLTLREGMSRGSIKLAVVNSNGYQKDGGVLLAIHPNGLIYRHYCVNSNLPFELTDGGRVKFYGE